jgi:protocatechuate 3,4-dioxygenase beta subunit
MVHGRTSSLSRRSLLGLGASSALLAACQRVTGSGDGAALSQYSTHRPQQGWPERRSPLVPTPQADEGDSMPPLPSTCAPTAANIEGPFFKAGAPHRSVLVAPGEQGELLTISGSVLSADCRPLAGAQIDVWHADARGDYDLEGFRHRGRLCTGPGGVFQLATIVPGRYLNGRRYRPAHIHVKLEAPGHRPLTTQLYFEGDPYNRGDDFIVPSLIMDLHRTGPLALARFDFVLAPA